MAKDRIESKYVTVAPGVELHILEKGEGKPLVFIPGLTFSGEISRTNWSISPLSIVSLLSILAAKAILPKPWMATTT